MGILPEEDATRGAEIRASAAVRETFTKQPCYHTWQVSPGGRSDPQQTCWGWGCGRPCQCKLPIELRDDLARGLASASRSRDDVLGSPSAIMPQLPGGAIHSLLGDSDGVDGGHKSLHDAKVVMDDRGRGAKQLVV